MKCPKCFLNIFYKVKFGKKDNHYFYCYNCNNNIAKEAVIYEESD